jgi:hypothetical protein
MVPFLPPQEAAHARFLTLPVSISPMTAVAAGLPATVHRQNGPSATLVSTAAQHACAPGALVAAGECFCSAFFCSCAPPPLLYLRMQLLSFMKQLKRSCSCLRGKPRLTLGLESMSL